MIGSRKCFRFGLLVAAAAVLWVAGGAPAAPHGSGGGGHPGSGGYHGGPYYGGRGYGYGYHRGYYYPGFYGFYGLGYPYYYGYGRPAVYIDNSYYSAYPPNAGVYIPQAPAYGPPTTAAPAVQPPPEIPPDAVLIGVQVPPDAQLWFDGAKTSQTGRLREFITPALTPGKDYHYEVRARWTEDGRTVERRRTITVRAGDQLGVNFLQPEGR